MNRFHQGVNLENLLEDMKRYLSFTRKINHMVSTNSINGIRLLVMNLCGLTTKKDIFGDHEITEDEHLANCHEHRTFGAVAFFQTIKSFVLYLYGLYDQAYDAILQAEKVQGYIAGVVTTTDFNFYYSLILAALCEKAPAESREGLQSPHAAKPGPDEDMG